jgi:hypothetical protein
MLPLTGLPPAVLELVDSMTALTCDGPFVKLSMEYRVACCGRSTKSLRRVESCRCLERIAKLRIPTTELTPRVVNSQIFAFDLLTMESLELRSAVVESFDDQIQADLDHCVWHLRNGCNEEQSGQRGSIMRTGAHVIDTIRPFDSL